MSIYVHDPQADLDYKWDWSPWLAEGETISTHSITITPASAVTVGVNTNDATSVTAWITGGTANQTVQVTCHVVTSQSREDDRTIYLVIRNR